ncbi:uncharacterized protein ATNIH1004_009596 [Aspergillus tanneri]|nr:uncharacterized protein ATNIH1004_009596 [Aspergillus tanneri]KAA8642843.1 hypothetical protein ATNIH1004_009596 [Aspergillus tanneri]
MPKKVKPTIAPGSSKSITVRLKSARNPPLEFTLPSAPLSTTSVNDLKDAVRERVADAQDKEVALDKIKILYKRKPVTGKSIAEILSDEPAMLAGGKEVEFGVMIMGGAKVVETGTETAKASSTSKRALGPSGEVLLETDAFWDDLEGYLQQRLKDVEEAKRLRALFKGAWAASR